MGAKSGSGGGPPARVTDREQVRRILDLSLRAGSHLLSSGAGTADVAATMAALTSAYGVRGARHDITAATIIVSVPRGVKGAPLTLMWSVEARVLNYERLRRTLDAVRTLSTHTPSLDEAHAVLDGIDDAPPRYPSAVATVALGVMAAAFAVLLGAGPLVAAIAWATTVVIDRIGLLIGRRGVPMLFRQVVAGVIATGVTLALQAFDSLPDDAAPSLVVASNIVALMSGMAIVTALQDAITGYELTSVGRLVQIMVSMVGIFLGIGAALRIGAALGVHSQVHPVAVAGWLSLPVLIAAGALGSVGAAVAGYASPRAALAAGVAGAMGTAVYFSLVHVHAGNVASSFVAATTIGFAGAVLASRLRVPPLVIIMSGIIPMVPGVTMYHGFVSAIDGDLDSGLNLLVAAVGTAIALAGGVVLGPLLAPVTRRHARRLAHWSAVHGAVTDHRWLRGGPLGLLTVHPWPLHGHGTGAHGSPAEPGAQPAPAENAPADAAGPETEGEPPEAETTG